MNRPGRVLGVAILWFASACTGGDTPPARGAADSGTDDGITVREEAGRLLAANDRYFLRYDLDRGLFSTGRLGQEPVIENAFVEARSSLSSQAVLTRSTRGYRASWTSERIHTAVGNGRQITITLTGVSGLPDIAQTFTVLSAAEPLLMAVGLINHTGKRIRVGTISPAIADQGSQGGLRLGCGTDTIRILENGLASFLDFYCRLAPGTLGTLSNWNTAIHDLCSGENLICGGLTFERGEPLLVTRPADSGPYSLTFRPLNTFNPPRVLAEGERLDTEVYYLNLCTTNPLAGLEDYALAVKNWQGISLWTERHPEVGVPSGWNSWSGSSGSGGYGTDIDEAVILANLDFMDRELRKWGMNYFQIDDGWQVAAGDWEVRTDRFPDHDGQNGIAWLLGQARSRGFHTGLWVSPYNVLADSRLATTHPEWLAEKDLIGLTSISDDMAVLDLTRPDVQQWLTALMSKLTGWGCDWIKLDFGYWFLMTRDWAQRHTTRVEAYRQAQRLVRDTLGPDTFFLNVAVMGPNYGLVDSDRIGLDTMPVWEGEKGWSQDFLEQIDNQGIKPSVRTLERRYYLHDRVWVQHPDLLFFRAHADPAFPPLTPDESRALGQVIAYSGGLVKLGEKLVEMSPDAVQTTRALLPIYGACGRPLDLFRREFAEVWSLAVPDFAEPYHTVGVCNWGLNLDLTRNPYVEIPDQDRDITVDFQEAGMDPNADYLAYEFWSERFLGEFSGSMTLSVPKHSALSIALRRKLGRPQFVGSNRHVLGGAGVIREMVWDDASGELRGRQEGSIGTAQVPFVHHLAFWAPEGYAFRDARFQVPDGISVEGVRTLLTPADNGSLLDVRFRVLDTDGEQAGEVFSNLTWTLTFGQPAHHEAFAG